LKPAIAPTIRSLVCDRRSALLLLGGETLGDASRELGKRSARAAQLEAERPGLGGNRQELALTQRSDELIIVGERHQDAVPIDNLGDGFDRCSGIDLEFDVLHGTDIQFPPFIGQSETPSPLAADDEGKQDAASGLCGHRAVDEPAVFVGVGTTLPHAGNEGMTWQDRPQEQHKAQGQAPNCSHGHPSPPQVLDLLSMVATSN
jgi:hypothetical protein